MHRLLIKPLNVFTALQERKWNHQESIYFEFRISFPSKNETNSIYRSESLTVDFLNHLFQSSGLPLQDSRRHTAAAVVAIRQKKELTANESNLYISRNVQSLSLVLLLCSVSEISFQLLIESHTHPFVTSITKYPPAPELLSH